MNRLSQFMFLASLMSIGVVLPNSAEAKSEICFSRQEEPGFINIVPVSFHIGRTIHQVILTGENKCILIDRPAISVLLTWAWDPRDNVNRTYYPTFPRWGWKNLAIWAV